MTPVVATTVPIAPNLALKRFKPYKNKTPNLCYPPDLRTGEKTTVLEDEVVGNHDKDMHGGLDLLIKVAL